MYLMNIKNNSEEKKHQPRDLKEVTELEKLHSLVPDSAHFVDIKDTENPLEEKKKSIEKFENIGKASTSTTRNFIAEIEMRKINMATY